MSNSQLQSLLQRLHEELGRTTTLDEESRALLHLVLADIARLGFDAPATAGGLETLAIRFEADHPAAAATLRQVSDLLGKAGI
ncbi:MAG TPA: DUF4404 family protein [Steroidobacteraceae bacterium]|nr:DUF4404 family protein [Steroidobacteraceae bacterium]